MTDEAKLDIDSQPFVKHVTEAKEALAAFDRTAKRVSKESGSALEELQRAMGAGGAARIRAATSAVGQYNEAIKQVATLAKDSGTGKGDLVSVGLSSNLNKAFASKFDAYLTKIGTGLEKLTYEGLQQWKLAGASLPKGEITAFWKLQTEEIKALGAAKKGALNQLKQAEKELASVTSKEFAAAANTTKAETPRGILAAAERLRETAAVHKKAQQILDVSLRQAVVDVEFAKAQSTAKLTQAAMTAQTQTRGAMLSPSGAFSQLSNQKLVLPKEPVTGFTSALKHMNTTMRQTVIDGNDLHSAMRGLASGFNLLWLTWGNLAPLFAGAAISFGIKSVVELGSNVQHTFETIRVLSEESATSVAGLNKQMLELAATGPIGPKEIAEAMKVLSLAGMSAADVAASIRDVINFSVAGDVDLKKAADVMTTVGTAFGYTAKSYNYIGDVIAKTAAVSKSSVESIGEAFKTSSVLNKQYGVSLVDVGTGLAALANLGIQGSAAGTALRNMYVDLSGRTSESAAALAKFNVKVRDSNGEMKDVITITKELDAAMSKMTGTAQKDWLQTVLSERGAKPIIELLDLARKKAKDTGESISTELDNLRDRITNSAGFAIEAAATLMMTPLNQMKSVVATLQTQLVRAFDNVAPSIIQVSQALKNLFNSPEFTTGLENLIIGAGKLGLAVAQNIELLGKLAAAFVALKVGQLAWQTLAGGQAVLQGLAVSATSAATAITATGVAASTTTGAVGLLGAAAAGLGRALAWLNPITALLAAGATAWQLWSFFQDRSAKTTADAVSSGIQQTYIDYLRAETARLDENTEALEKNISVQELRDQKLRDKLSQQDSDAAQAPRLAAEAKLKTARAALDKFNDAHKGDKFQELRVRTDRRLLEAEVAAAERALEGSTELERMLKRQRTAATADKDASAQRNANATLKKAKADAEAAAKYGSEGFNKDKSAIAAAAKAARLKAATDKVEQAIDRQAYEAQRSEAKQAYDQQVHDLESLHRHKLVSEGWYEAQSLKEYNEYSKEMSKLNRETLTKAARGYIGARKFIEDSLTGEEKANALAKLRKDYEAFVDSITKSDSELELTGLNKINEAVNKANGSVKDLATSVNKFLDENANELAASATEVGEAFDKYTAAGMEAAAKQAEKYSNKIDEVNRALVEMSATITYLNENGWADQAAKFADAQKRLQGLLDQLKARSKDAQATAYKNAVDKLKAADFRKLTESIADAIIKGGVNSGPQLRAILEEEFLSKPFKVLVEAAISDVTTGGLSKLLSDNGATGTKLAQIGSNLKGVYDFVTSPTGWFSHDGFAANIGEGSMDVGAKLSQLGAKFDSKWLNESGKWLVENADLVGKYADAAGSAMSYISAIQSADKGKWGAAIGQAVGTAYFGPLGGAVGGAIGGWVDDAFGGGRESSLGGGITGTFGANGQFSGQRFDRRRNSGQSGFLGIGATSAREWDNLSSLETGVSTALSVQFFVLKAQTAAFAESLGLSTSSITAYTRAMRLSLGSDAAANQKAIADFFTTMANEMAAGLIDRKYFKEGETAADALARLSVNLTSVNSAFELMGKGKFSATLNSALGADALVTIFGGKDKFDSAQASFYNAFYSDAEKQANLKKSLETSFATLGKTLPATRDAFRQMVVAQDVTTDSGRQTYAQLLSLSEAFDSLTATAKKASEAVSETDFSTQVAYLRFKGRLGLGGSVAGLSKTPGFATGGVHSGGWRVVGEGGSELEHTGPSRIYNHADSLFDDANIVAQLKALREEISYLRADARATAANTKKAANVYDKWDADGMPEVRA